MEFMRGFLSLCANSKIGGGAQKYVHPSPIIPTELLSPQFVQDDAARDNR